VSSSQRKEPKDWKIIDFSKSPPAEFWKSFPRRDLPKHPTTRVNIPVLEKAYAGVKKYWTIHQCRGAERTFSYLRNGAPAYQKKYLHPMALSNAPSVLEHGNSFTTTLKEWLEKGFVAGPFVSPPVADFRANSLMAEVQKDKVRPILNMSSPKPNSFNDNVEKLLVPKTYQSSARMFGQTLRSVGEKAVMTKLDMRDAFKLVPARTDDLRLQGFRWLNHFFLDTQQIFGSIPSVANFDQMASTVLDLAISEARVPRQFIHRTLDDVVCVAPAGSDICQRFTKTYLDLCRRANIPLAEPCPRFEKAFCNVSYGTVLGIIFDTNSLRWKLSDEKRMKILDSIALASTSVHADKKQIEKLAGQLNNFAQMMPLMTTIKRPLNNFLSSFGEDYEMLQPIPEDLLKDLVVWHNVVNDAGGWLPIPLELDNPPVDALEFVSDAAGGLGSEEWAGVASVGHRDNKEIWFVCRGSWPESVYTHIDEKGSPLSSKMTTLELVGLFLPFLTIPEFIQKRNVVLGVDNVSVVFAWENGSVRGDQYASALVRALYILTSYLECRVFVRHVPRMTSLSSYMADSLTRKSTATAEIWAELVGALQYQQPSVLWSWLEEPFADWDLGFALVKDLKKRFKR
jgi:hypothetical protein